MPRGIAKAKRAPPTTTEDYDAEDGFIDDDGDGDRPSQAKKEKTTTTANAKTTVTKVEKTKGAPKEKGGKKGSGGVGSAVPGGGLVSESGEEFWEVGLGYFYLPFLGLMMMGDGL